MKRALYTGYRRRFSRFAGNFLKNETGNRRKHRSGTQIQNRIIPLKPNVGVFEKEKNLYISRFYRFAKNIEIKTHKKLILSSYKAS